MFANPMSPPIVQATKKQRAGNTPDWSANGGGASASNTATDARIDDAATKRRAELQQLRSSIGGGPPIGSNSNAVVVAGGPPIMNQSGGPPTYNSGSGSTAGGPPTTSTGFGTQFPVQASNANRNTAYDSRSRLPPPTQRTPPMDPSGGPPTATLPATAPPIFHGNGGPPVADSVTTNGSRSVPRPPPGRSGIEKRHSDIYPNVPKSPVATKAAISTVASPAQATAAALRSPKKSPGDDKVQRKLDFNRSKSAPRERPSPPVPPILHHEAPAAGQENHHVSFTLSTAPGPPQRPTAVAPTPFPGRLKKAADAAASTPPQPHNPTEPVQNGNAGRTPFTKFQAYEQETPSVEKAQPYIGQSSNAGRTPFTKFQAYEQETPSAEKAPRPVQTPYHHNGPPTNDDGLVSPPLKPTCTVPLSNSSEMSTSSRKDQLESMRAASSTPLQPPMNYQQPLQVSSELRLQQELARSEADRKKAFQSVTKLETEKIASLVLDNSTNSGMVGKHASFISPVRSPHFGGARMTFPTPTPVKKPVFGAADRQLHYHKLAVECSEFEYDVDNSAAGETEMDGTQRGDDDAIKSTTYVVRRPYEMETEQDLWYKCGQKPAKVYGRDANLDQADSIEVVAMIGCDESMFVVYGDRFCKHKKRNNRDFTSYDLSKDTLGSVIYSTRDLGDDQYDLQQLYEGAAEVRKYYCAATLSIAVALQTQDNRGLDGSSRSLPPPGAVANAALPPPGTLPNGQTSEADPGALSAEEKIKAAPNQNEPLPPLPDDSPDVLSMSITFFVSMVYSAIVFVCWTIPRRIAVTSFVMSATVVLLSYVWLYLADADHVAPIHLYANSGCIM